ncbi:alpha/beta hydrolase [Pseudolysinimonas sp.]|jgi:acetyl esterase/lipase|uniref:alpha/beta hydrolase n=1 Tax=Pseudolysinimonas sp. TaxID=2680009 RepID=UPI0037851FFA
MSDHVIVLPGGGYGRLSDNESTTIVAWLESLGLSASVFAYPVGASARHPAVLDAVRGEIRARRDAGADRVALVGFSAGGHAAGHAALAPGASERERVDLVLLSYPVVSMLLPTHQGSRENLIGLDASPELRAATSLDLLVTPAAPPFFVWHTAADDAVPVQHSYLLGMALAAAGVRHALHVFPRGRHGLNLARRDGDGDAALWTSLAESWLREEGWLPR